MATTWNSGPRGMSGSVGQLDGERRVVAEVLAHTGHIGPHADSELAELPRRADARAQQQDGAGVDAAAEHDAAAVHRLAAGEPNPCCTRAVEDDVGHLGVAANHEVRTLVCRRQVGQRGAHADAVEAVDGQQPGAHCARCVVVVDPRQPGFLEGGEAGLGDACQFVAPVAPDRDRALSAVPRAIAEVEVALEPREGGQHVLERPPGVAATRPAVVVGRRAAERECPVGRRAAAEQAGARHGLRHAELVRLARVPPVEAARRLPSIAHVVRRGLAQVGPRLEQQHLTAGVLAQPRRHDAAGRAPTHDDHVRRRTHSPAIISRGDLGDNWGFLAQPCAHQCRGATSRALHARHGRGILAA